LKRNTSISGSDKSNIIKDENNESSHHQLEEALNCLEARLTEKGSRERAREIEVERTEVEAERAKVRHLAEGVDEKEALGAQILERVKQLRQDKLIRKVMIHTAQNTDGPTIIYERHITNIAELMLGIPADRSVRELFQLTSRGVLTYNQVYNPEHLAEAYLQHYRLRDPLRSGYKLACPADFQRIGIKSIKGFLEALEMGEPLRLSADKIKRLADEIEEE
jgi:hypothetical protein